MAYITKQGSQTPIIRAVQGDRNTKNFTFVVSRYDGEVDLSELVWMIEVENAAGETDGTALFTYRTEKQIQLTWTLGGAATAVEGWTTLQVSGFDTNMDKQWSSGVYYLEVKRKTMPASEQQKAVTQLHELIDKTIRRAGEAIEEMEGIRAEAETLPPESEATAVYAKGLLTLGIPKGDRGVQNLHIGPEQPPEEAEVWITLAGKTAEDDLPPGKAPYQMIVTGPDGVTRWEERTHYDYRGGTVLPLTDLAVVGGYATFQEPFDTLPQAGTPYKVTYLGFEYECTGITTEADGKPCVVIGNESHMGSGLNTREPFIFVFYNPEDVTDGIYGWFSCLATDKTAIPVSIVGNGELKKIDKKFLPEDIGGMPEGGAPYQQLVTDGEGNTVWEDRLAYADENVETLLDLTFEGTGEDNNNTMSLSSPVETEPIEGETYTVMWNGTAYKCVAKKTVISDDAYAISLGDEGMTPFGVVIYNQLFTGGYGFIASYDNAVNVPVSILHETENIKKVDPKYLPEGIGYEEPNALTVILPETELVNMGDDGFAYTQPLGTTLVAGETYTVTYNGQRYDSTAVLLPAELGVPGAVGLGNVEAMGGTGGADMPFVLVVVPDNLVADFGACVVCMPIVGAASVTLSIAKGGGLHRIPLKFLPEYMYGMEQSDRAKVLSARIVSATATASVDEPFTNPLVEGCEYTAIVNGVEYKSTAKLADDGTEIYIGAYKGATDDPYYVRYVLPEYAVMTGHYGTVYNGLETEASIEVFGPGESIRKVPEKFLPAIGGALTITADYDMTNVTISNISHTYEQAKEAFLAGKEVRLLLKGRLNENTNYYVLPAIILTEDDAGTNKMMSFQLAISAFSQSIIVMYNGLTGEAEVSSIV